jgi:hypothetical protein
VTGPASRLAPGATGCDDGGMSALPAVAEVDARCPVDPTRIGAGEGAAPVPVRRPKADELMRRILRIDEQARRHTDDELRRGFSQSMLVSAVRCILTYLVLPFVVPLLGVAAGVGPILGIAIGVVAIVFNVRTIRRFWMADHRWRWAYTAVGGTVMALLVVLIALDVAELLG